MGQSLNQQWLDAERDREREARIVAMEQDGKTQKQIGEVLGISPSRVGQILKRLRREANRT